MLIKHSVGVEGVYLHFKKLANEPNVVQGPVPALGLSLLQVSRYLFLLLILEKRRNPFK